MNQYPTKQIDRRPRLPLFDKCLLLFGVAISVIGFVTGKWQELHLVEVICIVVVVSVIRAHYRHTRLCCPTCKIIIKMQSDESSKLFVIAGVTERTYRPNSTQIGAGTLTALRA